MAISVYIHMRIEELCTFTAISRTVVLCMCVDDVKLIGPVADTEMFSGKWLMYPDD